MRETPEDLIELQKLVDDSIAKAGDFLRDSFEMPEHSLSAKQLVTYLTGSKVVALASTTAKQEPRVAPIASLFYRGRFHIPTIAEAARAKHFLPRPAASLTHYIGIDFAIIVHGSITFVRADNPDFAVLEELQIESGNKSPTGWGGEGVYLRIEPDVLYSYARRPEQYSEG
jgi:hypothetical protein